MVELWVRKIWDSQCFCKLRKPFGFLGKKNTSSKSIHQKKVIEISPLTGPKLVKSDPPLPHLSSSWVPSTPTSFGHITTLAKEHRAPWSRLPSTSRQPSLLSWRSRRGWALETTDFTYLPSYLFNGDMLVYCKVSRSWWFFVCKVKKDAKIAQSLFLLVACFEAQALHTKCCQSSG